MICKCLFLHHLLFILCGNGVNLVYHLQVVYILLYTLFLDRFFKHCNTILGGLAVLSIIIPTALTISENWPATQILGDPSGTYFEWNYVKPWCRFSPYIVGLILGYILHVTKNKAVKMNSSVVVWLWLCAFGIGFAVVYGLDLPSHMDPNNPTSKFVNAFYGGFHRAAWGIALGWLIFACCKGYGGDVYYNLRVSRIASRYLKVPLGPLLHYFWKTQL